MLPQASAYFAPLIFTLSVVAVIYTRWWRWRRRT
jgi:NADH:ubiquinone oxidoreductase subunit 4 (subunit M)